MSPLDGALAALRRSFVDPEPPLVAVEVRPRAVGVVRLAPGTPHALAAAASLDLPEGTLKLSMTEPNVSDEAALRQTLKAALERAGVLEGGRAALVLPDPVARPTLLPAADVRGRRGAEADEVVRFLLRKAVPFEVREARIAFRELPGGDSLLAVAGLRSVLDGYEQACRDVGLEPGRVELAGLAILDAVEASRPAADRLVVNWDDEYVTLALVRQGVPALLRTLVGPLAAPESVAREVANTILYFRERLEGDKLGEALVRAASIPADEALACLEAPLGFRPALLEPWGGALKADAGTPAQALAGAAASVLRRVA